jgi:molecular chaperone DnaK (HSP70)
MSTSSIPSTTVAVGIDLGSYNGRVATFDEALNQPVVVQNRDGHHATRVLLDDEGKNVPVTLETLAQFYQEGLLNLASDAAHTKDLHVVTSIPNTYVSDDESTATITKILQGFGGVITEAAAVCLAFEEELQNKHKNILVIDGGASAVKATLLKTLPNGMYAVQHASKLDTVNGNLLVQALATSVAQQFEQKHRFPKGEVMESKKARAKLQKACESGLTTLQRNSTVTIHVDGLYEGMDCQVTISKPKWEHLSGKLSKQVKEYLVQLSTSNETVDCVLLAGNMHVWLQPIVASVFKDKMLSSNGSIDPSEAIAVGCTKQAFYNLSALSTTPTTTPTATPPLSTSSSAEDMSTPPAAPPAPATMPVSLSPISIGIQRSSNGGSTNAAEESKQEPLIAQGTPLPAVATHNGSNGSNGSDEASKSKASSVLEIWQWEPTPKALCKVDDWNSEATLKLQLSEQGQLTIWVNGGESIVIG